MKQIVEKLVLFNNRTFNKSQWNVILKGCGCPKNTYFWKAMRDRCLFKYSQKRHSVYTLQGMNEEMFKKVWNEYSQNNVASVKRVVDKKKAIANVQARAENMKQRRYTIINGCVNVFGNDYDFD